MKSSNIKTVGYIFQTTDYDLFSLSKINRDVQENKRLEESIIENGLLNPIKVSENFEIIDGQHRFEICRKLKIPIDFYYAKKGNIKEIIEENSNRNNWKITDYAKSYSVSGDKEYTKLLPFLQENKIPSNAIISIASGNLVGTASEISKKFKRGKFSFLNYEMFKKFYEFTIGLRNDFKIDLNGSIVSALYQLYTRKNFSPDRLIAFLSYTKNVELVNSTRGQSNIIEILVFGYNNRLDEKSPKFIQYSYRGNNKLDKFMILTGETKDWAKK